MAKKINTQQFLESNIRFYNQKITDSMIFANEKLLDGSITREAHNTIIKHLESVKRAVNIDVEAFLTKQSDAQSITLISKDGLSNVFVLLSEERTDLGRQVAKSSVLGHENFVFRNKVFPRCFNVSLCNAVESKLTANKKLEIMNELKQDKQLDTVQEWLEEVNYD